MSLNGKNKGKARLSVALAVYNEQENLERCLRSVRDIADEIVLVDGGSSDRTVEIARSFNATVIQTDNPPIFHINKQKALDASAGPWILQLDADEVVSKELKKEISAVLRGNHVAATDSKKRALFQRHQEQLEARDGKIGAETGEVTAYFVPRLNYFMGGWLRHGGVYPDGVIRLVRKGKASFPCKSVHEQIRISGRVEWLTQDLLHYSDPTFARYLERADRYTTLTAREFKKRRIPLSVGSELKYLLFIPVVTWFKLFIRHKGFLDGIPGFVFALFSGLHFAIAYMKYWEMEHGTACDQ